MTEQRTARRISVLGIIAFVLLAALLLTLAILSTVKSVRTAESYGNVVRIEDGRTVVVNMDGTEETVTLAGVVAPRLPAEGQEATAENCLAEEAQENLAGILEPGAVVQLEYPDQSSGPGGTKLALIRHSGEVVNIVQTEAGFAVPSRDQPLEQLGTELQEAQDAARENETGLYSQSVPCTLAGRIEPAVTALQNLPGDRPSTSAEADDLIAEVSAAVEQGVAADKVFNTIDPNGSSLTSLAWGDQAPRLQERLNSSLSSAQSELKSLQSTRKVLLTREREEAARQREEARQAELERQRQEAARQAELERQRQEGARQEAQRQAEERQRRAEESASPSSSPSSSNPSTSPSPSKSSSSPSPKTSSSSPKPDPTTPSEDESS
ncbi:hypothetical protein [Citricoccus sp. GCM10030269]|uniref:thermonuclease family protein n=1 Tax=Citricoccus sp. GCM10030269 TaxID=3273388 RepID=UPI003624295A